MLKVKELRDKRARLITEARQEADKITDKTPAGEAAKIEARFNAMLAEAETLEARAASLERLANAEATGDPRRPVGENRSQDGIEGPEAISYRSAFHALLRAGGDAYALAPEMRAALAGNTEFRAQVAGTDAAGGYLVPDEMMQGIVETMAAWGPMFDDGFATVINTPGGGSMPIPGVDDTAKRAAKNTSEGAPFAKTGTKDAVFTRSVLGDFLYDTEWLSVSIQLATGAMGSVEGLFGGLLGKRLGRTSNDVLTVGSGVGEPQGIVTGASLGKTTAGVAAVTADEVQELIHSVDPAYRASPKFGLMFNDTTLLALHKLKDGDGTYLLKTQADGSSRIQIGAVSARYTINQAMPNMGTGNRSMIAGDMGAYFLRKIGGVIIATARDSNFLPGFGIAGFARFDGLVSDTKAIKALQHA